MISIAIYDTFSVPSTLFCERNEYSIYIMDAKTITVSCVTVYTNVTIRYPSEGTLPRLRLKSIVVKQYI